MRGRAVAVAEERMLAVLAGARVAGLASVQPARELEAPVPAARRLEEVAGDRAHVPELRARGEAAGFTQRVRDLRIGLELAERRPGSDLRPVDPARHDPAHVDQRLRL